MFFSSIAFSQDVENKKAVIPLEVLRLFISFPLPFAGITQTGFQGLPGGFSRGLSAKPAPLALLSI